MSISVLVMIIVLVLVMFMVLRMAVMKASRVGVYMAEGVGLLGKLDYGLMVMKEYFSMSQVTIGNLHLSDEGLELDCLSDKVAVGEDDDFGFRAGSNEVPPILSSRMRPLRVSEVGQVDIVKAQILEAFVLKQLFQTPPLVLGDFCQEANFGFRKAWMDNNGNIMTSIGYQTSLQSPG